MLRFVFATLILVACTLTVRAGQIHVPGDFVVLQDAIDIAAPGDVIVVDGGVHGPVVIEKPLFLVGRDSNRPLIQLGPPSAANPLVQAAAFTLAGPGSGAVTISGFDMAATVDWQVFGKTGEAVKGGGFDELRILHCAFDRPAEWTNLGGTAFGQYRISVDVPFVLVSDSIIRGGEGADDDGFGSQSPTGYSAIVAPDSTVAVFDSVIVGGSGLDIAKLPQWPCSGGLVGGQGAPAVVADVLVHANSLIRGGDGARIFCGTQPDQVIVKKRAAVDFEVRSTTMSLPSDLSGNGPLVLGNHWQLRWSTPSPTVTLLTSFMPRPPAPMGSKGLLFMDPLTLIAQPLSLTPSGHGLTLLQLPSVAAAQGFPLVFQVFDAVSGLTRPVYATLMAP